MTGWESEIGWQRAGGLAKVRAMTATARKSPQSPSADLAAHVDALDWPQITGELDSQGCAILKGLLAPYQCRAVSALYPDDTNFRSRIVTPVNSFMRP